MVHARRSRASQALRLPAALVLSGLTLAVASVAQAQTQPVDPTAALLSDIIKVNTSNPPGTTQGIADLLGPKLKAAGFTIEVFPTPEPGKVHFIARLKGDGSKKPVLLAAHADVVGVEREKWTVDPFAGLIKDGHVYGRGAVDFKGGHGRLRRRPAAYRRTKGAPGPRHHLHGGS